MKRCLFASLLLMLTTMSATAGGILTNTNQSVLFLKNPARDAAIGLDGVYSNPAGVAFMPEGFHLAFNWQYAHQTRTINSTNPLFKLGRKNNAQETKNYEGATDAPFIPSLQAAYNTGNWSFQGNISIPAGGGACEFADGLGSFESVVGNIAKMLQPLGAQGYDMNGFMRGRQYYFGFQFGTAYKITGDLSVYGGLRLLYGSATYKAKIDNIQVKTEGGYVDFGSYLQAITAAGYGDKIAPLQKYAQGVNLLCNQSGVGIAPIIGVDYKLGRFNFAAKYEFKTPIRMKNESTVNEASEIAAINKYRDGESVDEDNPAQLAIGAQWSPLDNIRINLGWHHFFDKQADWYNNTQDLLDHNSNEYLAGVEWDVTDRLNVSAGGQLTRYGLTDEYMNDMSYVVNSYSVGLGFSYKVKPNLTLSAAYFRTIYDKYNRNNYPVEGFSDTFTRTNSVLGLGCQVDF